MTKHEFPKRRAFGPDERTLIEAAMLSFELSGDDPHYQRMYEKNYTDLFCHLQDGGYADAVASGTAAVFIAVKALDLPPGSTVLCSPITDAGTLSAIILAGHKVKLVDAVPDTYNIDDNSIEVACHECRKEKTAPEALVVVHSLGTAARVSSNWTDEIMVVEDCSQAHLARYLDDDSLVGTRGDISAFSTMARKAHISGGCGGLVYTRDLHLHRRALAHADRGKPAWKNDFDDRDPAQFMFPALNLHQDELSSAIGWASLGRLKETIEKRRAFVFDLSAVMRSKETAFHPVRSSSLDSPFALPVFVKDVSAKQRLAHALLEAGIPLNPHYKYLAADWPWLGKYRLPGDTPNARAARDSSFVLYLNENYGEKEADVIFDAMQEVS